MAIIQEIKDGKIVENVTSSKKTEEAAGGNLGYDEFLQILCAEMQYQDPLEPTSNTEYISQLATFSQLESTLSMQNTIEGASANDLVGKYVIMKVTSSTTGETTYASGTVEYVLHQGGETYLSINDQLYSLDDLDTVADSDYMEAVALAEDFAAALKMLPSKNQVTLSDKAAIQAIRAVYDSLTVYQKSFINADDLAAFEEIEARLNELIAAAEQAGSSSGSSDSSSGTTDGTSGSTGSSDSTGSTDGSSGTTDGTTGSTDGTNDSTKNNDSTGSTDETGGTDGTTA